MAGTAHRNHTPHTRRDLQAEVTGTIIAALEAGTPPWRKPWDATKDGGLGLPRNAVTGLRYRGINTVTLSWSPLTLASGDPRWCTYRQAADRGWQVRKGEHGTPACFYKRLERTTRQDNEDSNETGRHVAVLRSFTVFHASQIDGIPTWSAPTLDEAPWRTPDSVTTLVANSGADVRTGGSRAFYAPSTDHIQMPPASAFATMNGFITTLLHEAGHWTAGPTRLARDLRNRFGTPDYAREEVRVELAQAMICAEMGLACEFGEAASYIASWLEVLRSDRKEVFRAAADAQRIADYLLAFHPDYDATGSSPVDQGEPGTTEPHGSDECVLAEGSCRAPPQPGQHRPEAPARSRDLSGMGGSASTVASVAARVRR